MSRRTLILGATSAIARALAAELARRSHTLALAARDTDEAELIAADLRVRFDAAVRVLSFDASDFVSHDALPAAALDALGGAIDTVAVCHGFMADQADAERDPALSRRTIDTNYTSVVSALSRLVPHLPTPSDARPGEPRPPHGVICVVSSVAGDRPRSSNFIYGSSKAAVNAYLQGLAIRLIPREVSVVTVKPGFVDTAMTWGLLNANSPAVAQPARVAADIARAIDRAAARPASAFSIYTPWFWRWIMLIIKLIPSPIFRRMRL